VAKLIKEANGERFVEVPKDVLTRMLVEVGNPLKHSILQEAKIIHAALRTRGLTRTLLRIFSKLIDIESGSIQTLSRHQLLKTLISKRRLIRAELLSRLLLTGVNYSNSLQYRHLTSVNYFGNSKIRINKARKLFSFEVSLDSRQKLPGNKHSLRSPKANLLEVVISLDSEFFLGIVHKYEIYEDMKIYLKRYFPAVLDELNSVSKFTFQINPFASQNLDIRSASSNQPIFESLKNVEIWHQRFIIKDSTWSVIDITTHPALKFVAGQWQFFWKQAKNNKFVFLRNPRGKKLDLQRAIFLSGRCDDNWFHFLIDTLPRIQFFANLPKGIPVLIRSDIPDTAKEVLRKVTKRPIIEITPDSKIKVQQLYFVAARSSVFDSRPLNFGSPIEFPFTTLKNLRDVILSERNLELLPKSSSVFYFERDAKYRNMLNSKAIRGTISKFGIPIQVADSKFLRNQVEYFYDADLVISPGGAVLANILFMRPGSKVLVLRSWRNRHLNLWEKLSIGLEVRYLEITGVPVYFGLNSGRRMHTDYWISPRKLESKILELNTSRI